MRNLSSESLSNRLIGLRDAQGVDLAIGIINDWQNDKAIATIRAPNLDIRQIHCLVIADLTIDLPGK